MVVDISMSEDYTPASHGSQSPTIDIPSTITQDQVDADVRLKHFQNDLLILTSFNENESLYWRPTWFKQAASTTGLWTIHNPPDVVTYRLSLTDEGRIWYSRRGRESGDRDPHYIKDWAHWRRYCNLYGIPHDFLCAEHRRLILLGHVRNQKGDICAPPEYPLYPEPPPLIQGAYILSLSTYKTHLPKLFHNVKHDAKDPSYIEVVVVSTDGALTVENFYDWTLCRIQGAPQDGIGSSYIDQVTALNGRMFKLQGPGKRWSYLPWTDEQEKSCRPLKIKLSLKRTTSDDRS